MVASGSSTGRQDAAFDELVNYMEWNENLKAQTGQAMIYPAMLITGVIGLFLLLMLFVIPRFTAMFADADFELPALTRGVMATGHFLGYWWWLLLIGIGSAVVAAKLYVKTDRGAYHRDRILLATPVMGVFLRKLALSRFSKSFSLIFSSGVDLLSVLRLMGGVVGNRVMAVQLDREIPRDLKKALSVFETLVIVVLAALVSVAALALLMPVMQVGSGIS